MAARARSGGRRNLFAALGLLVGVGACGRILGVKDYTFDASDETGGAETGGARVGGRGGDIGVGGRVGGSGGSESGGAAGDGRVGGTAGLEFGGSGGRESGGGAGDTGRATGGRRPTGGTGGATMGGGTGSGGVLPGGSAGQGPVGGFGGDGATGGVSGGEGGASGGDGAAGGANGGVGTGGATGGVGTGGATGGVGTGGAPWCDPLDPVTVCGANRRCVAHEEPNDPTCESGVGTRESYRYCTSDASCLADHACVFITPDESENTDSSVCVQWCRVGHPEDCAVDTEECFSFATPRYIGSQEWGICTPPDAPAGADYDYEPPPAWNCDPSFWGQDGFCDCGCGVFDPDCSSDIVPFDAGCNCQEEGSWAGSCANNGVSSFDCTPRIDPENNALCVPAPAAWTCPDAFFGDGFYCDCGCGVVDIDCDSATAECDWCGTGSCGAVGSSGTCANIDPNDNSSCI